MSWTYKGFMFLLFYYTNCTTIGKLKLFNYLCGIAINLLTVPELYQYKPNKGFFRGKNTVEWFFNCTTLKNQLYHLKAAYFLALKGVVQLVHPKWPFFLHNFSQFGV